MVRLPTLEDTRLAADGGVEVLVSPTSRDGGADVGVPGCGTAS